MSNGVCVKFLVLNLLLELLPMSRLTSHKTRPGNRSVISQSHARRPRCKRRMSAQCSSNSHQAIRALLRIQHPRQQRQLWVVPKSVLKYFTCTVSPPCCAATVTGSTLASLPSRCHSRCLYLSLGRGPLFTCRFFSRKGWATTPSCALSLCLSLTKTTVTAAWHTTHLVSRACSCKFTLLPAVARRTCDV